MRIDKDWVARNWAFIKKQEHRIIPLNDLSCICKISRVPRDGKFYGDKEVLLDKSVSPFVFFAGEDRTDKLFLRPYILATMPEGVRAVYMDIDGYELDSDGDITAKKDRNNFPVYVFIDSL